MQKEKLNNSYKTLIVQVKEQMNTQSGNNKKRIADYLKGQIKGTPIVNTEVSEAIIAGAISP